MASPVLLTFGIGFFLRYWLSDSGLALWLSDKNEISTPLTSWNRVTEGLALYRVGISPYTGDIFHEMPLMLRLLNFFTNITGTSIYWIFIICDIVIALILDRIAKNFGRYMLDLWKKQRLISVAAVTACSLDIIQLAKQASEVQTYSVESQKLLLKGQELGFVRLYIVAAYLFNPYSLVTCLAKSTAVFNNLAIIWAVYFTLTAQKGKTCVWIALAAYISMYPIMLVVPAAIFIAKQEHKNVKLTDKICVYSMLRTGLVTVAILIGLLYVSAMLEGSWMFLHSTYGFILSVPDLTPNMGVFWYFFTEMFEHFRLFFICVFQINAFIYTVPLSIRLRDHPMFLMYTLIALMSIFKSYPSYADAALYLALLPLWRHTFDYMRNNFVVSAMFVVCTILAPILYYLWIYAGSANANFYFAITLVYSTAQIFLLTDLIFAFLRREYDLLNGAKPKIIDGKEAQIILD